MKDSCPGLYYNSVTSLLGNVLCTSWSLVSSGGFWLVIGGCCALSMQCECHPFELTLCQEFGQMNVGCFILQLLHDYIYNQLIIFQTFLGISLVCDGGILIICSSSWLPDIRAWWLAWVEPCQCYRTVNSNLLCLDNHDTNHSVTCLLWCVSLN